MASKCLAVFGAGVVQTGGNFYVNLSSASGKNIFILVHKGKGFIHSIYSLRKLNSFIYLDDGCSFRVPDIPGDGVLTAGV